MPRQRPLTRGKARDLEPPWHWKCGVGHRCSTPAGIELLRCAVGPCKSTVITAVSADGNPVRKERK